MVEFHPIAAYLRALWAWNPTKTALTLVLMVGTAITDGIALMSLLPLLGLVGIGNSQDKLAQMMQPLNLKPSLPMALTIFVALIAVRAVIKGSRDIMQTDLRNGFVDRLRIQTFAAISRMRWQAIMQMRFSDLTETLLGDVDRVGLCTFYLLRLFSTIGVVIAYAAVAINLSPAACGLALGLGAVMLLTQRRILNHAHTTGRDLGKFRRQMAATASTYLNGIKAAKAYNRETDQIAAFADAVAGMRHHLTMFSHGQTRARGLHEIGGAIVLSALVWLMLDWLQVPTAQVLLMIVILARLLPMGAEIQQSLVQMMHSLPAFTAIQSLLGTCERNSEIHMAAEAAPPLTQAIVFDQVQFRYTPDTTALDHLCLTIPARQTTALMGASGAGKSTIADLLVGLISPTAGRILIDGQVLTEAMIQDWRRQIAYVPQEVFLFHDSVRANLRWGAPAAADDEIWTALTQAAAADFVRALPNGLDTVVGEGGMRLSGGERQRLALARAFLRRPALLVLDEATSALDTTNEQLIQQALRNVHGNLTIVLIAHRLSTVQGADQVLTLDAGRLLP